MIASPLIVITLFVAAVSAQAQPSISAADDPLEARLQQYLADARQAPTLRAWIHAERERVNPANPGYTMMGPKPLCNAMRSVGLGCSYNERSDLVTYLYANGVDLFPCKEGSNPYTKDDCHRLGANYLNYIGYGQQNEMLRLSVLKNRDLFRAGDLTAEAAKRWQR